MRYFEDYIVGQSRWFDGSYAVTEEEIMEVGNRWDPQYFHIDKEAAADSIFGGLVASSVHLFAMCVNLGNFVPEQERCAAMSALGFDNMRLHGPARPGDQLRLKEVILESRTSNSRPEGGIVKMRNELFNQHDEMIFSFDCAAMVRRRG
jgi:acyl dehydratase